MYHFKLKLRDIHKNAYRSFLFPEKAPKNSTSHCAKINSLYTEGWFADKSLIESEIHFIKSVKFFLNGAIKDLKKNNTYTGWDESYLKDDVAFLENVWKLTIQKYADKYPELVL